MIQQRAVLYTGKIEKLTETLTITSIEMGKYGNVFNLFFKLYLRVVRQSKRD